MKGVLKKTLLVGILLLSLTSVLQNANAYHLTSWRWPSYRRNPLYYYVASQWTEFNTARNDWNNAGTHFGLFLRLYNPEYCYVVVIVINPTPDDHTWQGYCLVFSSGGTAIAADIGLNADEAAYLNSNGRRTVCAHEIGHLFSLDHENNFACIMHTDPYWRRNNNILGPQANDILGVNVAY